MEEPFAPVKSFNLEAETSLTRRTGNNTSPLEPLVQNESRPSWQGGLGTPTAAAGPLEEDFTVGSSTSFSIPGKRTATGNKVKVEKGDGRVGADGPSGVCRYSGQFVRHLSANKIKAKQNGAFCELRASLVVSNRYCSACVTTGVTVTWQWVPGHHHTVSRTAFAACCSRTMDLKDFNISPKKEKSQWVTAGTLDGMGFI